MHIWWVLVLDQSEQSHNDTSYFRVASICTPQYTRTNAPSGERRHHRHGPICLLLPQTRTPILSDESLLHCEIWDPPDR